MITQVRERTFPSLPRRNINTVGSQSAWGALLGVVKSFPPFLDGGGLAGGTTGKRDPFMAVLRWKYKFAKDYPSFSAMKNKIANGIEGRDFYNVSLSSRMSTIRQRME